jgi:hypothetical protein
MKKELNKSLGLIYILLGCLIVGFTSCKDDDNDSSSSPMKISAVYLENARETTNKDRLVEFVRLGQTLRLEGSGFTGLSKIYVNGYENYFNPVFVTDNNVWFQISGKTPTTDAEAEVRNTIVLAKGDQRLVLPFVIREAAPSITRISHTMPQAGDEITIYGTGLRGVTSITFPGDVVVTDGIVSDNEDGKWATVTVPSGITGSGSLLVICANGGVYSPAYFNYKEGVVQNFDNVITFGYIGGEVSDDLNALIPASGNGPKSQGIYRSLNKDGKTVAASDAVSNISKYWMNNSKWPPILTAAFPGTTPCDQLAVQMDIYFEGIWNSGDIRFVVADGYTVNSYCMIYAPWEEGGARVPFVSPGAWFTITLPLSESSLVSDQYTDSKGQNFVGKTLADLIALAAAHWDQSGPHFENGPINKVPAEATNINVYFDNIRFVPLNTPAYSDFPDE